MTTKLIRLTLAGTAALVVTLPLGRCGAAEVPRAAQSESASNSAADSVARGKQIAALIEQLGGDDFFVRERAQQELADIGFEAFDALSEAAENSDDIEIQLRARYLVRLMRLASVQDGDPVEIKALLSDYESRGEAERIAMIKHVAALGDDKGVAVLCRLVRFERSAVLSKEAAVALLLQKWPADEAEADHRAQAIRRGIGRSARPASAWLAAYVAGRRNAAAVIDEWQTLVAAEERRATEAPHQTRPDILAALWREQSLLLRQLGRAEEADQILMRIVESEEGASDSSALETLFTWIIDQRAFRVVDQVAEKFADQISANPLLLYALANARKAQGREDLMREAVDKALSLDGPGNVEPAYEHHHRIGFDLWHRHHWRWAEGEYRKAAELAPRSSRFSIDARARLSEALHDRGADEEAAKLLEQVVADMEKNHEDGNDDENARRSLETTRARMHFFFACSLRKPEQRNERIQRLLDALEEDAADADALIALYRVPDLDAPLARQNLKRIGEAAETFSQQIKQQPDDPTPYNQFAWLIANTEGDYREALRCSEKSLELVRSDANLAGSESSFLDTLGRCYYAVGDYESAVKTQSRAVEIDPESGLMATQLQLFREALQKAESEK